MKPIEFSTKEKEQIIALLQQKYKNSPFKGSQNKFAISIGLSGTDMTYLLSDRWKTKKDAAKVGPRKWIDVAIAVGYTRNQGLRLHITPTMVYQDIYAHLQACQTEAASVLLCDEPGVGKTATAKHYADTHHGAIYIDCSIVSRKIAFVRKLARTLGLDSKGKIDNLIERIVATIKLCANPVLILDEAGDMDSRLILLVKQLYNQLEGICGFYLMGSDGLRNRIQRGVFLNKLGFTEILSRTGGKPIRITSENAEDRKEEYLLMAEDILRTNGITQTEDIEYILEDMKETTGIQDRYHDLRRLDTAILKWKKVKQIQNPPQAKVS